MTYIDFAELQRMRTEDMFSFAPIEIEATMAFTGEVMRDNTRRNAEAMAPSGAGICRVMVESPSPRLRQRLAILGWLPADPARDDRWYLDEPVELRVGDNHVVSDFVARYYAEGMNLLFAPDDGMFTGCAFDVVPAVDAPPKALSERVKQIAERAWVSQAVVAPSVPPSWLVVGVERAVGKENAARERAGLAPLVVPSASTLGRWLPEFRDRHRNRDGVGSQWRNYENPGAGDSDAAAASMDAACSIAPRGSTGMCGAHETSVPTVPVAMTRAARARVIVEMIRTVAAGGRWELFDLGGGGKGRVWVVDLGHDMEARFTTRFSGVSSKPSAKVQERARKAGLPPFEADDATVDLYLHGVGKILSVATRRGVDELISMMPGPWEENFGLPNKTWSPAVMRRLEDRLKS